MSRGSAPGEWVAGLVVALTKGVISLLVLRAGFSAISDDDYARLTISQGLTRAFSLDPSQSSWLPAPFLIQGGFLELFGASLASARVLSVLLGSGSAVLFYVAARRLGASLGGALAGALIASIFPYSAYLGAAVVPELPTAALTVFAVATLAPPGRHRTLGALACALACASRYEAWPVGAVFVTCCLLDARRSKEQRFIGSALVAVAFPLLWVIHGIAHHDDPFFFVHRVHAYRAASGPLDGALVRLSNAPRALFQGEPELMLGLSAVLGLRAILGKKQAGTGLGLPGLRRFLVALGSVVLMAVAAELSGSGGTHHPERALLPVWVGASLLLGHVLFVRAQRRRWLELALALLLGLGAGAALRSRAPRAPFVDRSDEIALGRAARRLGIPRFAIEARDYGYFAVQAAFQRPWDAPVLDDLDPRRERDADRLVTDPGALARELRGRGIDWLALARSRAPQARRIGSVREESSSWALVELGGDPPH